MAKVIMHIQGMDGNIELRSDRVIIHRPGIWNMFKYGINAKREIPLSAISEVAFRDANAIRFGEIEFVRSGRSMDEKTSSKSSAVRFGKKKQHEFEVFKEKVFELMEQYAKQRQ